MYKCVALRVLITCRLPILSYAHCRNQMEILNLEHRQKHTATHVSCQKGFALYPRLYETPISARVSSHSAFQRLRKGTSLQELTTDAPGVPMLPFPTRSPGLLPWTCLPLASMEQKAVRGVVGDMASKSIFLLASYFPL